MAYNEKHKQFLQYFMRQRLMTETDANKINKILFPEKKLDLTIEVINSKIIPLEFKINKSVCEQSGDVCYAFIASFFDDFNSKKDPNKVIFSKLVDYIIEANGSVPYDEIKTFHSNMSDNILDAFFANKYLITDYNKNIYLSPLAISELEAYLADKFADKTCMGCMRFVAHGLKCQSCEKFIHRKCLYSYFINSGNRKCLSCSQVLPVDFDPIKVNYQL